MNVKPFDEGTYECQNSKSSILSFRDKGILLLNGKHKYGVYSCFSVFVYKSDEGFVTKKKYMVSLHTRISTFFDVLHDLP